MAKSCSALVLAIVVAFLVVMMVSSDLAFAARNLQTNNNSKANNVVDATRKSPSGSQGLKDNKNFGFSGIGGTLGGASGVVGPFGGVVGGAGVGGGVGTVFPVGGVVGGGVGGAGGVGGIASASP